MPPRQTAACKGCGLLISERRRRACPRCGSMNRAVAATATDTIGLADRAG